MGMIWRQCVMLGSSFTCFPINGYLHSRVFGFRYQRCGSVAQFVDFHNEIGSLVYSFFPVSMCRIAHKSFFFSVDILSVFVFVTDCYVFVFVTDCFVFVFFSSQQQDNSRHFSFTFLAIDCVTANVTISPR